MSILSVNHLSYSYPNGKKALDDISFVIEKGSYTAIVGKNGSGKSTLSRLICSLLPSQKGCIEIAPGVRIGLVFQSPKDQIVSSIVSRDTAFGPQNLGLPKDETELRTIECLNIVDLLEKATSSSNALSLGQTQKLAMAGMLALWPEILILDEAVAMLDPETRKNIFEFLRYWHKSGNTILHITHDMDAISEADNIICLEKGQMVYYGTKNAFLKKTELYESLKGPELEKSKREQSSEPVVFSLENVFFNYDSADKKSCVEDISFGLQKGTITALTGPSGAGKSTILELGCGLLKADEGKVCGAVRPVLVQQNASAALFEAFAADDVAFGARNHGIKGKELKQKVKDSMNLAYLPYEEFAESHTNELSGGQQRRLAIAGILAMDPDVIFFDEPSAGLDGEARYQIMQMMKKLAAEGKTILFSTHQIDEALFADREIKILNGKVVFDSLEQKKTLQNIDELKTYDATSMLSGLRNTNLGLSGSKRVKKAPVEKLPAALRILLFFALFITALLAKHVLLCGIMLAAGILYCVLCGMSIKKLLISFLRILPFLLFFSILQLVFQRPVEGERLFTHWKWFLISPSKLWYCLAAILRTDASLAFICGVFVSTPEYDLIDGLKVLLKPLTLIKIPVNYFILIMEIIFRFIPLLMEEIAGIIKTQIIRGSFGQVKGVFAKIKAIIPLVVPLIIRTVQRSEILAEAITMRGF